jgi:hypothetical protein
VPETRSLTVTCAVHGWPLRDGVCPICDARSARGVTPARPCPPLATWPKGLRVVVLAALELRCTQFGTEAERQQRSWEDWLRSAAMDGRVIPRNGPPLPIADIYDRMLHHLNLAPASAGKE